MSDFEFDLGIIGAGQMGYAIAEGAIKAGVVKNVLATRPSFKNPKVCEKWEAIGAKCSIDNTEGELSRIKNFLVHCANFRNFTYGTLT